jgi:hypothetical protein
MPQLEANGTDGDLDTTRQVDVSKLGETMKELVTALGLIVGFFGIGALVVHTVLPPPAPVHAQAPVINCYNPFGQLSGNRLILTQDWGNTFVCVTLDPSLALDFTNPKAPILKVVGGGGGGAPGPTGPTGSPGVTGPTGPVAFTGPIIGSSLFFIPASEVPKGLVNGINPSFSISAVPFPTSLQVFRNRLLENGVPGSPTADYTFSGQEITFKPASIPKTGDTLTVFYQKTLNN